MVKSNITFRVKAINHWGGVSRMFAVAGYDRSVVNSVEEWVEGSSSWTPAANLNERRHVFGSVEVPRKMLC